jgi:hypothetical protein
MDANRSPQQPPLQLLDFLRRPCTHREVLDVM